jgi:predicted nucleotidyltransferase
MSKELLKNTKFKSEIKNFFGKNKNLILDVIIFGSSVKGKEKPKDIDLLVIYKDKKDIDLSYELKKRLKNIGFEVEITDKTYHELFESSFNAREAMISEGYSVIQEKFLGEGLGYVNFILFKYELRGFSKSKRMLFYYALYGREKNPNGILKELNAIKFSETVLFCPIENSEKMKEFFNTWQIKYNEFPILIPKRIKF